MRAAFRLALGVAASATGALACSLVYSLGDVEGTRPVVPTPPPDAEVEAAAVCTPKGLPPKPAADGPGGNSGARLVYFALSDFSFGTKDQGLDLDGQCTQCGAEVEEATARPSCLPRAAPGASAPKASACSQDGVDGIDNALGPSLVQTLAQFQKGANTGFDKGYHGLILRLDGWNGDDDDVAVRLQIQPSTFGIEQGDAGVRPERRNDGNDVWEADQFPGADKAGRESTEAYVIDRVLYARFRNLRFHIGKYTFNWSEASLRADITPVESTRPLRLQSGVIGARAPLRELLTGFQSFGTEVGNFCEDPLTHAAIVGSICPLSDVMRDPKNDGSEKTCDAISLTAKFAAVEGKLGREEDVGVLPPELVPCGPSFSLSCD